MDHGSRCPPARSSITERAPTSTPSGMTCPPATYEPAAIQTSLPMVSGIGCVGPAGERSSSRNAANRLYWLIVLLAPMVIGACAHTSTASPSELLRPMDRFQGRSIRTSGRTRTVGSSWAPNSLSSEVLALYRGLGRRRKTTDPKGQRLAGKRDRCRPSSLPSRRVGSAGGAGGVIPGPPRFRSFWRGCRRRCVRAPCS